MLFPKNFQHWREEVIYALPQDNYDFLAGAALAKRRRIDSASSASAPEPLQLPLHASSNSDTFFETVSEDHRRERIQLRS